MKRESGVNPGQSRCCEAPQKVPNILATGLTTGKASEQESVRRPARSIRRRRTPRNGHSISVVYCMIILIPRLFLGLLLCRFRHTGFALRGQLGLKRDSVWNCSQGCCLVPSRFGAAVWLIRCWCWRWSSPSALFWAR